MIVITDNENQNLFQNISNNNYQSVKEEVLTLQNIDWNRFEPIVSQIETLKSGDLSPLEDRLRHLGQVVVRQVEQETNESGESVALQLRDRVVTQIDFLELARILEAVLADLSHLVPAQIDLPKLG